MTALPRTIFPFSSPFLSLPFSPLLSLSLAFPSLPLFHSPPLSFPSQYDLRKQFWNEKHVPIYSSAVDTDMGNSPFQSLWH